MQQPRFLFLPPAKSTVSAVSSAGTFPGLMVPVHLADYCRNDEKEHQAHNKCTHRSFLLLCIGRCSASAFLRPLTVDS